VHLSAEEAVDFAADLAQRRATALADAGHLDEAIGVYDEEARGYRARLSGLVGVPTDPSTARRQGLHLGKVLMEIGSLHARMRRAQAALENTAEALSTVRRLGPADSPMAGYVLSRVLWGYAWVRVGLGVELPQALLAVEEAEEILRDLARTPPPALAQVIAGDLPVLQSFLAHLRSRAAAERSF